MRHYVLVFLAAISVWWVPARANSLSGQVVTDHGGQPVPSAAVNVYGHAGLLVELKTGIDGRFRAQVPEGDYRLEVSRPSFVPLTQTVAVHGADANVVTRLIRQGAITGQVKDKDGNPLPGIIVAAFPRIFTDTPLRPTRGSRYGAATDARGHYRIYGLPPGEYFVFMAYGNSVHLVPEAVTLIPNDTLGSGVQFATANGKPGLWKVTGGEEHRNVNFTFPPAKFFTVTGKVQSEDGRTQVMLVRSDHPGIGIASALAGPDGNFRFPPVGAGSYRVIAASRRQSLNYTPGTEGVFGKTEITVTDADVKGVLVKADTSRTAKLLLRTSPECPSSARVTFTPAEEWGEYAGRTVTLAAGEATELEGLAPSLYTISGIVAGNKGCFLGADFLLDLRKDGPPQSTEVVIGRPATIHASVPIAAESTGRASAMLLLPGSAAAEIRPIDRAGSAVFEGLRPGTYYLGVMSEAGTQATPLRAVELGPSADVTIDLHSLTMRAQK